MSQKGNTILISIVVLAVLVAGGWYWYSLNKNQEGDIIGCPQDAKICPDGSAVGRTGPNCEFAACPQTGSRNPESGIMDTSDWKTYRNEDYGRSEAYGFEFKYPATATVIEDNTDTQLSTKFSITGDDQYFIFDRAEHLWYIGLAEASNRVRISSIQMAHSPTYKTVDPEGYADAGGMSDPYSAYWIQKDDGYYGFTFYRSLELSDLQKQILSTFKFLP